MSRYRTQILTTASEVATIAEDWKECLKRQERSHIEHFPESLLIDARLAPDSSMMVVALYEEDRLVGMAPFLIRRWNWECRLGGRTLMRCSMRRARLYGNRFIAPEDRQIQEALLQAIITAPLSCQMISVKGLAVGSLLWQVIQEFPVVHRHCWIDASNVIPHRMIHLSRTFEEYLAKFSSCTRRSLRRSIRQLEEACQGQVQVERVTERQQLPPFLKEVEKISERSWQGVRLGKVVRPTGEEMEHLGSYADRGWLRSYLLKGGPKPITFFIGYQADGTCYGGLTAYDPEWAEYSPGKVLLYRLLEDLFTENRPEWVDLGHGDRDYKQFWSNYAFEEATVNLIRKSAITGIVRAVYNIFDATTRVARAGLGRFKVRDRTHRLPYGQDDIPHSSSVVKD